MKLRLLSVLLLALAGPQDASAQATSGATIRELRDHCSVLEKDRSHWKVVSCLGIIVGFRGGYSAGAYDADRLSGRDGSKPPKRICTPRGVTNHQVAAVFVRWATAHPEVWHEDATSGLWAAMVETWPCR